MRTTATRVDGGGYVVRGTKLWTSHAQHADWMYALVRTGTLADRHRGLSFVVFPMSAPGITVRPITSTTGRRDFNEVVLEDVPVAADGRIGEEGQGWRVALTVLASERLSGRFRYAMFRREAEELARQLDVRRDRRDRRGADAADPAAVGPRARPRRRRAGGHGGTGPAGGVDARGRPRRRRCCPRSTSCGGRPSTNASASSACASPPRPGTDPDAWYDRWLEARAESIYGGTAQIQRDILAERHLGLPRGRRS